MKAPTYYAQFRCIGPQCEDSCCRAGWHIGLDPALAKRLHNTPHPVLGPLLREHVLPDLPQQEGSRFHMNMADGAACGMLDDSGLCRIHAELGEDLLPDICASYPRALAELGGSLEAGLTPSCPEAARLILLPEAPIGFCDVPSNLRQHHAPHLRIDFADTPIAPWVTPLRELSIRILQAHQYDIEARLLLLGELIHAAEMLAGAQQLAMLPGVLDSVSAYLDGRADYGATYAAYPVNIPHKLRMLISMLEQFSGTCHAPVLQQAIRTGINLLAAQSVAQPADEIYLAHLSPCATDLTRTHAHVFENYLVNHAFLSLFPFGAGDAARMTAHWRGLVVHFALLRFILSAIAATGSTVDHAQIVTIVQAYSRWADHAPEALRALHDTLAQQQWHDLASMVALLREK